MAIDTKTQETLKNQKHQSMRRGGSPEPSCQLPTAPACTYLIHKQRKEKEMKTVDTDKIRKQIESEDFAKAKQCPDLLYDENGGPALWHKCYCDFAPKSRNMPQSCNLVWRGSCINPNF